MIFKYFSRAWVLILTLLLLSSCLNSSDDNVEYSPDAQIYGFSLTSKADTSSLLSATAFTIDQINGKIFNLEPLPFQFEADSVLINIRGYSTYSPFALVELQMDSDSTFNWIQSDSVAINKLKKINTIAPDGKTRKTYDFTLNIYEEDPYILSWNQIKTNYLPTPFTSQRTINFKNRFITYYTTASSIQAMSTPATDGVNWDDVNLIGLPPTLQISSLTATSTAIFGLDPTAGTVYQSLDGASWQQIQTTHTVKSIFGALPLATQGEILVTIDYNGSLTFAETDDFIVLKPMNKVPVNIPVKDFSATPIDDPTSYSIKYIILAGGSTVADNPNNDIWILQEKDGIITHIMSVKPVTISVHGSSLFFYDNKPYMMTTISGKNALLYSDNFGLNWKAATENQTLPTGFNQRNNASVITDAANYIWIFGGISATQTQLADVWRGRLNKFATN